MFRKAAMMIGTMGMLSIFPGFAQAGSIQDFNPRPYIGAGLGVYGLEESQTGFSQKSDVFGGYVNAGVDFNDYLGLELRLGTTAKGSKNNPAGVLGPTSTTTSIQADYFVSYLAKLQYPVAPQFDVRAMLGATTARVKYTTTAGASSVTNSRTKTGFSYGLGADYKIDDNLSAGVEWMQYWNDVNVGTNSKGKIWGVVASIGYHF